MSSKQDKKLRQIFKRDMREKLEVLSTQHFKDGPVFKNKPKYIPKRLWVYMMDLLIDDNFMIRYMRYLRETNQPDLLTNQINNHAKEEN